MLPVELLPEFVHIPAGTFQMGTPEQDLSRLAKAYGGTRESYREESPQHRVSVPAFAMAQTPVTTALYAAFVAASDARAPWGAGEPALRDHPVTDVSWEEAQAFCAWLTEVRAQHSHESHRIDRSPGANAAPLRVRLPTEAEWEYAARGADGRTFPWGDTWDVTVANTRESGLGTTTAVGTYLAGASPFGLLDMAGNVWEWTASLDTLYPYQPHDGREAPEAPGRRILRGGCYANPHGFARCACRFRLLPGVRNAFLGFRIVLGQF